MNYALINNQTNIVENVIVLDEGSTWTPPEGYYIVDITNIGAGIGWAYNPETQEWTPPPQPAPINVNEVPGGEPNVIG